MSEYLKFAHELADASGKVIRKYFRSNMTVEDKADDSPVTVADRLTETITVSYTHLTLPTKA